MAEPAGMMRLSSVVFGALACALCTTCTAAQSDAVIEVGAFSHETIGGLPSGWKPLTFPKIKTYTRYALVPDDGRIVVRADASASASGLITAVNIDPHAYPLIRWRWKIANLIAHADLTRKSGDDYPARLYINFRGKPEALGFLEKVEAAIYRRFYGQDLPTAAINYVWDGKAPAGTIAPNAYTERVRMIVVESGAQNVGRWIAEERNLLEDYHAAFGKDPPPIVSVAIMTDTDNTRASVAAWYGDISFHRTATR
jgi:Protein of unknown function (DUF3047)